MSTTSAYLRVAGIDVDVVYKDIKNLHIGVYPPLGRVRVAAPVQLDDDRVRLAVVARLPWINKAREQLRATVRQSEREMVTGESHYIWGVRHRLTVVEQPGPTQIKVSGTRVIMNVPPGSDQAARCAVFGRWQREQLRAAIPLLIDKWEPIIDRTVPRWSVRRMKTKWGSCNRQTGHLWFNLELVKKHPDALEYIVVHEMTHLIERCHGERFTNLLDAFLPDWRARRDQLNEAPLAHEKWTED